MHIITQRMNLRLSRSSLYVQDTREYENRAISSPSNRISRKDPEDGYQTLTKVAERTQQLPGILPKRNSIGMEPCEIGMLQRRAMFAYPSGQVDVVVCSTWR